MKKYQIFLAMLMTALFSSALTVHVFAYSEAQDSAVASASVISLDTTDEPAYNNSVFTKKFGNNIKKYIYIQDSNIAVNKCETSSSNKTEIQRIYRNFSDLKLTKIAKKKFKSDYAKGYVKVKFVKKHTTVKILITTHDLSINGKYYKMNYNLIKKLQTAN